MTSEQKPSASGWLTKLFGRTPANVAPAPQPAPVVPAPVRPASAPPSAPPDSIAPLIAAIINGADFVFIPAPDMENPGAPVIIDGGHPVFVLTDGPAKPVSGGKTNGYSIELPPGFETAASGQTVKVSVVGRAAGGAAAARFALAYSTNDVGNSGWRWFDATQTWCAYEMEYAVPTMKKGNGDFIGVLASPAGEQGIEIAAVAAVVVPAAAPAG